MEIHSTSYFVEVNEIGYILKPRCEGCTFEVCIGNQTRTHHRCNHPYSKLKVLLSIDYRTSPRWCPLRKIRRMK